MNRLSLHLNRYLYPVSRLWLPKKVHPDFFMKHPKIKKVNEKNMQKLSSIVQSGRDAVERLSAIQRSNTRTLVFYLKATEESPSPRRIRVGIGSLNRVEESIRDILETLGVELPPARESDSLKMRRTQAFKSTLVSFAEVEEYLQTLVDRRDIIAWREERRARFQEILKDLQNQLGVHAIDIRYNWSAESNIVMLRTLMSLIDQEKSVLTHTPWQELQLVMSSDDASLQPVDPVEGHIVINPSHVPLQWLRVMDAVTPALLSSARSFKQRIAILQQRAEHEFSMKLQEVLRRKLSGIGEDAVGAVSVRVRQGHTCNNMWFLTFLENLDLRTALEETTTRTTTVLQPRPPPSPRVDRREEAAFNATDPAAPPQMAKNTALTAGGWLALLPLQMDFVVEQGHGTKLLGSGSFRVDCRATSVTISNLLEAEAQEALARVVREATLQKHIEELSVALSTNVGINSIEPGVGVDKLMFYSCLERMCNHCNIDPTNPADSHGTKGKLRNLHALKVRIGRYLGLSDDGSVILPHDMDFTS